MNIDSVDFFFLVAVGIEKYSSGSMQMMMMMMMQLALSCYVNNSEQATALYYVGNFVLD